MNAERAERELVLEADVDARIASVWSTVWEHGLDEELNAVQLGVLLRAAYSLGYRDRGREDVAAGNAGALERACGMRLT